MRLAVAHLVATGPVGSEDTPVHAGILPIGFEPEPGREWICRPVAPIRRRLYDASRLDAAATSNAPDWNVVLPAVRESCAEHDVLFVLGTGLEMDWFGEILGDASHTRLADLHELARFFLPDRDLNDLVALCEHTVPGYQRGKPQLPFLLRAFRELLREMVGVVLAPAADLGDAHPVYGWLEQAVASGARDRVEDKPSDSPLRHPARAVAGAERGFEGTNERGPGSREPRAVASHAPAGLDDTHAQRTLGRLQGPTPSATAGAFEAMLALAETASQRQWEDEYALSPFSAPKLPGLWPPDRRMLLAHLRAILPEREPWKESDEGSADRGPLKPVRPEVLDATFRALVRREGADLRERPSQLAYAHFAGKAFHDGGIHAVEAGTGTGKTLGYLVPACEFVRLNSGRKVLIATATKTLQEQILREELPRLTYAGGLHQDLRGAVLKGKGNYLCAGALADLHRDAFADGAASSEAMLGWLHLYLRLRFGDGTIDDVPADLVRRLPPLAGLLADVSAEGACTSDQCRLGIQCVYPGQLRRAMRAGVVVTNHHKLGSIPAELAERVSVLIVDEADQLADNLRNALRDELTPTRLRRDLLGRLVTRGGSARRRGFIQVLEERIPRQDPGRREARQREDKGRLPGHRDGSGAFRSPHDPNLALLEELDRIARACAAVQARLDEIGSLMKVPGPEQRWQDVERKRAGVTESLLEQLEALEEALQSIASGLRAAAASKRYDETDDVEARGAAGRRREQARLERYAEAAARWRETAASIREEHGARDWVHTVRSTERWWSVARVPFDLSRILREHFLDVFHSIVLTSATLYVSDRLDFIRTELGLQKHFDGALRLPSPFDYEGHVYGAVLSYVPPYRHGASPAELARWMDALVDALRVLTVATEGRTLVLFTSTQEMREAHDRLRPLLDPYDIEVLLQSGPSRAELLRFRESEHTVLLGVDRFWVGIDVPGRSLSQVVVVRSPNPSLSDPLVRHRFEHDGAATWTRYYHPAARLRLRQGFGRLIRRETDRGLFIVLDSRLVTDLHMRSMPQELPIDLVEVPVRESASGAFDLRRMLHAALGRARLRTEFEDRGIDPLAVPGAAR